MLYQVVTCLGDSLTYGSRSPVGYPEMMAEQLEMETGLHWVCVNRGVPGATLRDVLLSSYEFVPETQVICLWAGVNDLRFDVQTPLEDMILLFRRLIIGLRRWSVPIIVGTLPTMVEGKGHLPYWKGCAERGEAFNRMIRVNDWSGVYVAELSDLTQVEYVDHVHLTKKGYAEVAARFAEMIVSL